MGPWWRWARLVARNESRVQSESLMALFRRAASWRPVATSSLHPVHVSTRPSHLTGVCRGRLGRLRSKPPGTTVVPDPPAFETFLPPDIGDTIAHVFGHGGSSHQAMKLFAKSWCLLFLCSTLILSGAPSLVVPWASSLQFPPSLQNSGLWIRSGGVAQCSVNLFEGVSQCERAHGGSMPFTNLILNVTK